MAEESDDFPLPAGSLRKKRSSRQSRSFNGSNRSRSSSVASHRDSITSPSGSNNNSFKAYDKHRQQKIGYKKRIARGRDRDSKSARLQLSTDDDGTALDESWQSTQSLSLSASYASLASLDSATSEPPTHRLTPEQLQAVERFYRRVLVSRLVKPSISPRSVTSSSGTVVDASSKTVVGLRLHPALPCDLKSSILLDGPRRRLALMKQRYQDRYSTSHLLAVLVNQAGLPLGLAVIDELDGSVEAGERTYSSPPPAGITTTVTVEGHFPTVADVELPALRQHRLELRKRCLAQFNRLSLEAKARRLPLDGLMSWLDHLFQDLLAVETVIESIDACESILSSKAILDGSETVGRYRAWAAVTRRLLETMVVFHDIEEPIDEADSEATSSRAQLGDEVQREQATLAAIYADLERQRECRWLSMFGVPNVDKIFDLLDGIIVIKVEKRKNEVRYTIGDSRPRASLESLQAGQSYAVAVGKHIRKPVWLVGVLGRPLSGVLNNGTKNGIIIFTAPANPDATVHVCIGPLAAQQASSGQLTSRDDDVISMWDELVEQAVLDLDYGEESIKSAAPLHTAVNKIVSVCLQALNPNDAGPLSNVNCFELQASQQPPTLTPDAASSSPASADASFSRSTSVLGAEASASSLDKPLQHCFQQFPSATLEPLLRVLFATCQRLAAAALRSALATVQSSSIKTLTGMRHTLTYLRRSTRDACNVQATVEHQLKQLLADHVTATSSPKPKDIMAKYNLLLLCRATKQELQREISSGLELCDQLHQQVQNRALKEAFKRSLNSASVIRPLLRHSVSEFYAVIGRQSPELDIRCANMAFACFDRFLDRILQQLVMHPTASSSTAAQLDEQRLAARQAELDSDLETVTATHRNLMSILLELKEYLHTVNFSTVVCARVSSNDLSAHLDELGFEEHTSEELQKQLWLRKSATLDAEPSSITAAYTTLSNAVFRNPDIDFEFIEVDELTDPQLQLDAQRLLLAPEDTDEEDPALLFNLAIHATGTLDVVGELQEKLLQGNTSVMEYRQPAKAKHAFESLQVKVLETISVLYDRVVKGIDTGSRRYTGGVQAAQYKLQIAGFTAIFDVQEVIATCYPDARNMSEVLKLAQSWCRFISNNYDPDKSTLSAPRALMKKGEVFLKRNLTTEVLKQLDFAAFTKLEEEVTEAFAIMTRCVASRQTRLSSSGQRSPFTDNSAQPQLDAALVRSGSNLAAVALTTPAEESKTLGPALDFRMLELERQRKFRKTFLAGHPAGGVRASASDAAPDPMETTDRRHRFEYHGEWRFINSQRIVSQGGSAIVRLARCIPEGTVLAVKTYKLRNQAADIIHKALEQELSAFAALQKRHSHDNIVKVFGMTLSFSEGLYQGHLFMEYCKAGSLSDFCKDGLDIETTSRLINQLLNGIGHLHKLGIAHLDIKPANVMLANEVDLVVKIIDFGSASWISGGSSNIRNGQTLEYACPEFAINAGSEREWDISKADVWALGLSTIHMLTGQRPAEASGIEVARVVMFLMEDATRWRRLQLELISTLSDELKLFVEACLEVDNAARPSVEQLKQQDWMLPLQPSPHVVASLV
eukprot:m.241599 g.241599  ORF g.241599 m.241599 type:complete len:1575 (+) comp17446_c0_seq14:35-4759(+)